MDSKKHSRTYFQAQNVMRKLAVLDFDGTIYKGDSMLDFAKFNNQRKYFISLIQISIPYLMYLFGATSREELKATFVANNFTGFSKSALQEKGKAFHEVKKKNCFLSAVRWMENEKREGTKLLILSGSFPEWVKPFADEFGAELISTEFIYESGGRNTGKWKGKNVAGPVKRELLQSYLDKEEKFDYIMAFGNSKSDGELAPIVDEYHRNYFY